MHTGTARYMYALASHSAHSRRQYSNILTSQSPDLEMSLYDVVSVYQSIFGVCLGLGARQSEVCHRVMPPC